MVSASVRAGVARPARIHITTGQAAVTIIVAFTVLRLGTAFAVGLGVDESYTLAIARHLQLSYFDHPPLHLWIVHLFSSLLGYGRAARLPFIALFAGSSWRLFVLTRRLFGAQAGVWAVLIVNLSAFFTVVAGSWVLPDGPLLFCLLAAADHLAAVVFERGHEPAWGRWLAIGAWLGLAGLSKYQAVFFALGVGVFLVSTPRARPWLRRPEPYIAALLTAVILTPVIAWNAQNHWASFAFQGGRAAPDHALRAAAPLAALAGQAALLLPWIFAPLVWATWRATRAGPVDTSRWFCVTLGLPGVVIFSLIPLWGQTALPHWAMPSWLFLIPLLADALAHADPIRPWPRIWVAWAAGLCLILWLTLVADAATGWVGRAWPGPFPKGDPTLESVEWTSRNGQLSGRDLAGLYDPFIVAMKWNEAGRARPLFPNQAALRVFSDDPRGFADIPGGSLVGRDALILVKPEDLGAGLARVSRCFQAVTPWRLATFGREGAPEIGIHVLVGHRLSANCSELGRRSDAAHRQWRALKAQDAP
jgi:hypothetical protein